MSDKEDEIRPSRDNEDDPNTDDELLDEQDDIIDGNDIENNEKKVYEESLDLDLEGGKNQIWLVRLPMFLAEKWRNMDNLKGQELGKIRINRRTQEIQMILNEDDKYMKGLDEMPHAYDIELTKKVVENEFIFTEQNLKKYEQRAQQLEQNPELQKQLYILKKERQEEFEKKKKKQQQQYKRNRKKMFKQRVMIDRDGRDRYIPYVKTIPKKTGLAGTVCHECQVIPSMEDPNYIKIIEQRRELIRNNTKPKITVLEEGAGKTMSKAGLSMRSDNSNFLKVAKEKSKDKNTARAIRMPKKELLDLLFKLFDEYDYWSLKGLKERTKQPEVYLKECLDQVAMLVKKGPYALKYTLKTEYKKLKQAERNLRLGELADGHETDEVNVKPEDAEAENTLGVTTTLDNSALQDEQIINNNMINRNDPRNNNNNNNNSNNNNNNNNYTGRDQNYYNNGNNNNGQGDDELDEDIEMEDVL